MIKAIIFDMDGLMFDTERVFMLAWDYAGEKIGIGKAGHMVVETLGMSITASYDVWRDKYGEQYNEDDLRRFTKEFLVEYYRNNQTPIKEGLYELLDYLKGEGYLLGIATSSPRWDVDNHLKSAGLTDCFQAIADTGMVTKSKPAPDLYIKAADLLGVSTSMCIALEDSKNCILSAHSAGCKVIMIPDLWQPDIDIKKLLYAQCDNLNSVVSIIKQASRSPSLL